MITEFDTDENMYYRREENIEWIRKQESKWNVAIARALSVS